MYGPIHFGWSDVALIGILTGIKMIALTVCYRSDVSFDADYYHAKHLPLVFEQIGPLGMSKAEVRKILGTPMGTPAPYQLIATLYFDDAESAQTALRSAGGQAVVADIANFYGGMPDLMIGEVSYEF
jgi:uncharacterized protein (TIGR02118 family)